MNNSIAYQVGQVIGVGIVIVIFVGIPLLFIIAFIRANRTRSKGWIITAIISGLPIAALIALFIFAFARGLTRGIMAAHHGDQFAAAMRNQTAADLLTAEMTPVTGTTIPYQISYPWLDSWKKQVANIGAMDQLYMFHDAYVGVTAEGIGVNTTQHACELSQKNISTISSRCTFTTPKPVEIDSHSWLTYDAAVTLHGIDITYRYYVYSDSGLSFQTVCWTAPAGFNTVAPVFDRIAQSFKFPTSNTQKS